jgi:predicted LPLAT superfamily acyltransferase
LALRLILWIALHLGRGAARLVLYPITLYFLIKARPQRIGSRRFLARALGRPASLAQVARHIHCFASTILDRVYLLAGQESRLQVSFKGESLVTERVAAGQGFLLLGAHLGSFEILRALGVERAEIPLKILMYPGHNRTITEVFDRLNPRIAQTVIPLGTPNTLLAAKEALDSGQAVGLLGDRVGPGESSVPCRFLGAQARFPTGPLALAAVTGVPVILFFGLYLGGNRYAVHFEPFAERVETAGRPRGAALAHWVQRYAERVEHYARLAPYNWFNFYDFWDEDEGRHSAP